MGAGGQLHRGSRYAYAGNWLLLELLSPKWLLELLLLKWLLELLLLELLAVEAGSEKRRNRLLEAKANAGGGVRYERLLGCLDHPPDHVAANSPTIPRTEVAPVVALNEVCRDVQLICDLILHPIQSLPGLGDHGTVVVASGHDYHLPRLAEYSLCGARSSYVSGCIPVVLQFATRVKS